MPGIDAFVGAPDTGDTSEEAAVTGRRNARGGVTPPADLSPRPPAVVIAPPLLFAAAGVVWGAGGPYPAVWALLVAALGAVILAGFRMLGLAVVGVTLGVLVLAAVPEAIDARVPMLLSWLLGTATLGWIAAGRLTRERRELAELAARAAEWHGFVARHPGATLLVNALPSGRRDGDRVEVLVLPADRPGAEPEGRWLLPGAEPVRAGASLAVDSAGRVAEQQPGAGYAAARYRAATAAR